MATAQLPILRRSAIEAASQCLFRYRRLYVEGVPDESDPALRGSSFHSAAHAYIKRLVAKQLSADAEEAALAFTEGIAVVPIPGRLIPEVRYLFDRWAQHFTLDLDAFMVAEERQETPDAVFTPDIVFGRPDALEIVDLKTYWVPLKEVQARAQWQSRFYVRNAMLKWPGFPRYVFTYSFVRYGTTLSLTFTPDELDALDRDVDAVLAMIVHANDVDEWPATPGPMCAFCTLACPVTDHPAVYPKRLTPELAHRVGGWLLAEEAKVKEVKKALKQYCTANGPVDVQGIEWANRPVEERKYPLMAVVETLRAVGLMGAFDDLTLSQSALAKVFKQFPEIQDSLADVVSAKTVFRFGAKKPGGEEGEAE